MHFCFAGFEHLFRWTDYTAESLKPFFSHKKPDVVHVVCTRCNGVFSWNIAESEDVLNCLLNTVYSEKKIHSAKPRTYRSVGRRITCTYTWAPSVQIEMSKYVKARHVILKIFSKIFRTKQIWKFLCWRIYFHSVQIRNDMHYRDSG